jgi:hypothetical protein
MSWTTPDALAAEIMKRWQRGEILAARVTGERLFPLELRLRRPRSRDIAERFGEVREWARVLTGASREARGFGYELRCETLPNRVQGRNAVPVAAVIPSEADALRLIRQQSAADRFQMLADETVRRHPALHEWLARRPLRVLEHAEDWERVLRVLDWFAANPRPGLYLRQLDIAGVDTKFIEQRRGLLIELLDRVLPEEAVDRSAAGARAFERRYGLRTEAPLVRFRLLDPSLYLDRFYSPSHLPGGPSSNGFRDAAHAPVAEGLHAFAHPHPHAPVADGNAHAPVADGLYPNGLPSQFSSNEQSSHGLRSNGLSDLALPHDQFAALDLPVCRVFITENRTNGLAFPDVPGAMVVFGLGYGLDRLSETKWLRGCEVYYWGDIDTHGFGILDRLRATLPHARSFLMDRVTLDAHRPLWGQEPAENRFLSEAPRLTVAEQALFDELRFDRLGERVRLEQERVGFGWLQRALEQFAK